MRVVLANRYFYPDQSATSRMVTSLAHTLAREGIETTVLASRSYHDKRKDVLPARETIDGIDVHRIWTSGFGRGKLVGRAVDYATFHLSAAAWFASMPARMMSVWSVPIHRFCLFRRRCRSACAGRSWSTG